MRYIFAIIGSVVMAVSLVALVFNIRQIDQERITLTTNLEQRASLLADSLKESVEPYYANSSQSSFQASLQKVVDKFANRERLAGIALYDNKGMLLATSSGLPKTIIENTKIVTDAMDSNTSNNDFFDADGENRYVHVDPLHNDESIVGALMVVQNAGYINTRIREIWGGNLLRLCIQIIIFSITIFIILRFFVFRQVIRLVESVKKIRMGEGKESFKDEDKYSFFTPLAKEITNITKSLSQARLSAREEARMRLEKLDSPWTAVRLSEFIKGTLKDRPIFVVSNREPYEHYTDSTGKVSYRVPAGGIVTAIEPVMVACKGTWIAWGSGDADKTVVDKDNKIKVPPHEPAYTLKRVWLTDEEVAGYYNGFSNEAMYPLCLMAHTRPLFRKEDWEEYKKVNRIFAKNVLAEIKDVQNPLVLIQDYHLALLPQIIKENRPDAQIGIFWHVPWPSPEAFSVCPWRKEILQGMLGADIVGFHIQQFCNNFINTVGKEMESRCDFEQFSVTFQNHTSHIKSFPIGVAFTGGNSETKNDPSAGQKLLEKLGIYTKYVGLGVDRLDYTKGLLERFKALEFFFDTYQSYRGNFTFLQIASPSRGGVPKYQQFNIDMTKEVERINTKFKTKNWQPIVLLKEHHSHEELDPLFKIANVCMVTSLHDGMNLVSKEYIATRDNEDGVLILSQFAGAVRDLGGSLVINPYSAEETSEAINTALNMPLPEQQRRMKKMRESIKNYNIYRWSAEFIKAVTSLS
ncbi:MAG: trehalose-6-phosphate synthase [Candidatus Pacebacteria bacterium]|nr:trehalose-6-phosphate synthase [Candidatus Paceibacterota bacterium]